MTEEKKSESELEKAQRLITEDKANREQAFAAEFKELCQKYRVEIVSQSTIVAR